MKFTKLKDTVAKISAFLGISEIPINAETKTTNFTEEQMTKLKDSFGDGFCESMVSAMNTEIKAFLNENLELKAMEDEIKAILAAQEAKVESDENPDMDKPNALTPTLELSGKEALTQLEAKLEEKDALIARLIKEPEDDVQTQNAQAVKKFDLKHSATHLFASSKQYDAFDKRPWNVRMRDQGIKATDFNADGSIPLLQDDVEHFVRENPEALNSLFNEHYKLPADWDYRTGVLDRTSDGFIIPGEVVQGRSDGWSPKGDFLIKAEEGRVYRKKIDITFKGYELQQIENTWVRSYNKDGSHPWKMSFIYFLLSELVKQQAADDANAQINGIYVENPGGDNNPGAAVNSQNGLLFLYWWFRDVKKQYRPAKLGRPTPENIVDYVKKLVLSIPEKDRRQSGLELQITETIMGWYRERAGFLYQHNYNTDTGKYEYKGSHVIDYPNIKFQVIPNMTNTEFMTIVSSKNVQVMDYNTNEKGKFTITHTRRDTDIFADYRLGIRLKFVGNKIKETDPRQFEIQKIWSNDVPIFPADTNVPTYDDTTGNLKVVYPSVRVDEKWKTDIEDIEGIIPGQIVKIYGNKGLAAAKKVKKNAKFNLKDDYELNTDGCLTMVVLADKTLKELSRTSSAPIVNPVREFNSDVLDVTGASQFEYTGEESVVLAEIINSSEGNAVKIFGTNTENVTVTIQANETISVDTTAVLASKAHYIVLINVDGIWYELERKTE